MSAQNKLAGGWEDSEAKTKKKKKNKPRQETSGQYVGAKPCKGCEEWTREDLSFQRTGIISRKMM